MSSLGSGRPGPTKLPAAFGQGNDFHQALVRSRLLEQDVGSRSVPHYQPLRSDCAEDDREALLGKSAAKCVFGDVGVPLLEILNRQRAPSQQVSWKRPYRRPCLANVTQHSKVQCVVPLVPVQSGPRRLLESRSSFCSSPPGNSS